MTQTLHNENTYRERKFRSTHLYMSIISEMDNYLYFRVEWTHSEVKIAGRPDKKIVQNYQLFELPNRVYRYTKLYNIRNTNN
jgi:hypothetical protein